MQYAMTLIADPVTAKLGDDDAEAACGALAGLGASVARPIWLAHGVACDIAFDGPAADAADAVRAVLSGRPFDIVVQNQAERRKRLLVADMESTIIENEMVDELADLLGIRDKVADITWRAMDGEINFRPALRERAALLGGLEEEALYAIRERITFMPGAKTLVRTMRAAGAYTALVSGGFVAFSEWVCERAGFHTYFANTLETHDGVVTGVVSEPILGKEGKREALEALAADHGLVVADALAVGDGANDLDMIRAAGTGVAFRAKPAVARAARVRIDHGDLTALLYLQGYRAEDFVSELEAA